MSVEKDLRDRKETLDGVAAWAARKNKPMELDKDGHLRLLEKNVRRTRADFLRAHGWTLINTPAEGKMPSGAPMHRAGTLDELALRPAFGQPGEGPRSFDLLVIEHKARLARTKPSRKAAQAAAQSEWEWRGAYVYRDRDGDADPIRSFCEWYKLVLSA